MNINQQTQSPGDSEQPKQKETLTEPKEGTNPPDAEDASEEEMQESDFGDKSYASPDFDDEDEK